MDNQSFSTNNMVFNGKTYDQVWTDRFNFFQQHGAPNTKTFKAALKQLPGLIAKMRVNFNFYAFFFGFIYFFIKGMWKGAVLLLLLSVVIGAVSYKFPGFIANFLGFLLSLIAAYTANYTYYRKEVLGEDDFNIFKGMRL